MTAKLIVTAVGLLLVGWVNWYFLFSGRRRPAGKPGAGRAAGPA
ncbi:MAG: hypothetical protein OEW05_05940 [Candidatus Aminicenantes bacterium]|nr:hypothetical protein [Candidatus Aminicenantes bacterium]